jgi:hypothetical protein
MSFKTNTERLDKVREGTAMCFGISFREEFEENVTVFWSYNLCLHRANLVLHTACRTVKQIRNLEFQVLLHPPFSPDLAPSLFLFFGPYKTLLHSQHFRSDRECMTG